MSMIRMSIRCTMRSVAETIDMVERERSHQRVKRARTFKWVALNSSSGSHATRATRGAESEGSVSCLTGLDQKG